MRRHHLRQTLCLLMALLLGFTLLPFPAMAEPDQTEEVPPEPLEEIDEEPVRAAIHAQVSPGVRNIVKRAYQLTEIRWTPQKDVEGWKDRETNRFLAGHTYKGIPYGQAHRSGSYVPWQTGYEEFLRQVGDPNSPLYTERAVSQQAQNPGPYYCSDCSALVSWAWGLPQREITNTLPQYADVIGTSLNSLQVGDCIDKLGTHVLLVTDITYNSKGKMTGVEVCEERQPSAKRYWYRSSSSTRPLTALQTEYLDQGYVILRSRTRESVGYSHSCAVPLDGDVCPVCGANPFLDLNLEKWYAEPVAYVVNQGLMSGTSADSFSPKNTVTRAMAVTMIWRTWHSQASSENPPFTDIKPDAYYYPALCWAWSRGIVSGTGPDSFGPKQACTRGQLVTMLWIAAGRPKPALVSCPFADVSSGAWYYRPVLWAYENGIVAGRAADCFAPDDEVTRAEAAAMFKSACILLGVFTGN